MKRFITNIDTEIWILLALSSFAWGPLLNPAYFFDAHDAQHSIFYVVEFDQTLRDGYLWPRWSPDFAFGYGYPLFNNAIAPLAIYLAEIVHLLGARTVTAVKVIYGLSIIGSGLAMYGFVRRLFGQEAGLLAGVVYMYAPFHLLDIYVRSAFAESVSLALLPLILWAFTNLIAGPSFRRLCLAGLSYGLLALTHSISLFTFTLFLIIYIVALVAFKARFNLGRWFRLGVVNAGAGILGMALAGIFVAPVILEQPFIKVEQWTSGSYNAAQHFVYFSQLFSPFWGFGYSGPGPVDDMAYQIGMVIFGLVIFSLVRLATLRMTNDELRVTNDELRVTNDELRVTNDELRIGRAQVLIWLGVGLLSIWLMTPLATRAWEVLPIAALVQFPWRLLIVTMLSCSIIIGALPQLLKLDRALTSFLSLIVILGSFPYTQPQLTDIPDWAETPLSIIKWDSFSPADRVGMVAVTEEQPTTSPMEAQYRAGEPLQVATAISGEANVETIRHGGSSDEIRVSGGPATIQFYTYDFPGWQVRLDGQAIPHRHEPPYGLITVDVPAGDHNLELRMGATPARVIGGLMSLLAVGVIVYGLFFHHRRRGA